MTIKEAISQIREQMLVPNLHVYTVTRLIFIEKKVNVDANHQQFKLFFLIKYDLRHS